MVSPWFIGPMRFGAAKLAAETGIWGPLYTLGVPVLAAIAAQCGGTTRKSRKTALRRLRGEYGHAPSKGALSAKIRNNSQ